MAVSALSQSAFPQPGNIGEPADAYHLFYWLGTAHLAGYTEWWYFNFYDEAHNVQAIFSYLINNPLNLSGGLFPIGVSDMAAVAYTPAGIVTESDYFFTSSFSAQYDQANVNIGNQNAIQVIDADTYEVSGRSQDGRLAWNLLYQREAPSWAAAQNVNVASDPWQLMSWLVYMPRAAVSGTLAVDGVTYYIDAPGYHDHNWGEWNLNQVTWNWAQYSDSNVTFDLGDFPNKPGGIASIAVNGQQFLFQSGQYSLTHTQWAYDFTNGLFYPTQSLFQAFNGTALVGIVMNVLQTDPLTTPVAPPKAVIYEQTVTYSGQCWIGGRPVNFSGDGFKEYTAIAQ